jgi:8-hydroxy-5-deazaflavin:NADPH oxidoreductase
MQQKTTVAILGGTGDLGSGLARVLAVAGYRIVVGSRTKGKAVSFARELGQTLGLELDGNDNLGAASSADIVILSVPYASHDEILREIKPAMPGKILVDAVVPLVPPKVSVVQLPDAGSPAVVAQTMLGPEVRVAAAFHNVGAKKLQSGERADCDVLVFADDAAVRQEVVKLANVVAMRGVEAGVLANATAAEALTSVLIAINRRYKVPGAGIRITGLPPAQAD